MEEALGVSKLRWQVAKLREKPFMIVWYDDMMICGVMIGGEITA